MKNDVIYLISTTNTQDEDGFEVTTSEEFKVFAEIKDVKYTEFYQSSLAGMTASIVVSVNYADYEIPEVRPSRVRIDDVIYRIIRRYRKKVENSIELTLQEVEDGYGG